MMHKRFMVIRNSLFLCDLCVSKCIHLPYDWISRQAFSFILNEKINGRTGLHKILIQTKQWHMDLKRV